MAMPAASADVTKAVLMEGNVAFGEGAIRAGCQAFFGYPITPQTELLEFMSRRMPEVGRVYLQAESEVAAINMVMGAAATGARVMTSSSSPGISLKQEGISYLAGNNLPAVIVNVMRAGPGLGNVFPGQGDYFQATKGGGHGIYRTPVLAPDSVQEALDLTTLAFDLADRYCTPVMVLADGIIGQMVEPVTIGEYLLPGDLPPKDWALGSSLGRERHTIRSIAMDPELLEQWNLALLRKYDVIREREVRWEGHFLEDAELAVVAFGTPARVALSAAVAAREAGIPAGLFRPISLFPFPERELRELAGRVKGILVVELNEGQMLEDVQRVVCERTRISFLGRLGGVVVTPEEVLDALRRLWEVSR